MIQHNPNTIEHSYDERGRISRDAEVRLLDDLTVRIEKEVKNIDRHLIANIYISLKMKPLLVLTGSQGVGKAAVTRVLMETFNAGSHERSKQLAGHPWWVNGNENASMFIEAQTRMNSDLLKEMIEEAGHEENQESLYLVCLSRISPGELSTFFADIAFQMNYGGLVSLPTLPLPNPVIFPQNIVLLATMDSKRSDWMDEDLISQGQIVYMHQSDAQQRATYPSEYLPESQLGKIFLSSHIRDHQRAFSKLQQITRRDSGAFAPVMAVVNLLHQHGLEAPNQLLNNIVLYLANAWSTDEVGLFHPSIEDNLRTATDYAIAQNLIPFFTRQIQHSVQLAKALMLALTPSMPHSRHALSKILDDLSIPV